MPTFFSAFIFLILIAPIVFIALRDENAAVVVSPLTNLARRCHTPPIVTRMAAVVRQILMIIGVAIWIIIAVTLSIAAAFAFIYVCYSHPMLLLIPVAIVCPVPVLVALLIVRS